MFEIEAIVPLLQNKSLVAFSLRNELLPALSLQADANLSVFILELNFLNSRTILRLEEGCI
jgi:hypothetical protein